MYKARLPWGTVTFCDASFAGEAGHKSQRARIHYLTSHRDAVNGNANTRDMHLLPAII